VKGSCSKPNLQEIKADPKHRMIKMKKSDQIRKTTRLADSLKMKKVDFSQGNGCSLLLRIVTFIGKRVLESQATF
jgi:hypothetical protein